MQVELGPYNKIKNGKIINVGASEHLAKMIKDEYLVEDGVPVLSDIIDSDAKKLRMQNIKLDNVIGKLYNFKVIELDELGEIGLPVLKITAHFKLFHPIENNYEFGIRGFSNLTSFTNDVPCHNLQTIISWDLIRV